MESHPSKKFKKAKMQMANQNIFVNLLSKGDNNPVDDSGLYPKGVIYPDESYVVRHVFSTISYSGFVTLLLNDYPVFKYTAYN